MSTELQEVSVEDSIKEAMNQIEEKDNEPQETVDEVDEEPKARDESGKFTKKAKEEKPEEPDEDPVEKEKPKEKIIDAPQSWGAAVKGKWAELPSDVRAEISKREGDMHQMLTRHDGELRLGRELKEIITPYMPIIQAEGGTPAKAVQDLLNTAYQLRTSPPAQKLALIQQIATQYGVDLSQAPQQAQVDPALQQVMDRINGIENTVTKHFTLQEQQEQNKIQGEIQAFAANPKNTYFEQVKAFMAPLLGLGQAKDLQEAYDKACWADPQIRSTLMAEQQNVQAEKRKDEIAKKKQASVSVTGSPGVKSPNSGTPQNKTAEESVREAFDELIGSRI